ncbi:hypothetical protein [Nodularia sp. UHCC 0506]|nr:hypothetical protein [Nodularia sp. UHCC 0506]MEA5512510.1 hypothetical protein [Nodularia sp. UHCC 0506]
MSLWFIEIFTKPACIEVLNAEYLFNSDAPDVCERNVARKIDILHQHR